MHMPTIKLSTTIHGIKFVNNELMSFVLLIIYSICGLCVTLSLSLSLHLNLTIIWTTATNNDSNDNEKKIHPREHEFSSTLDS